MAYKKRSTTLDKVNRGAQDTAIECHAGFVRLVVSLVKKHGYETVMSIDPKSEIAWVKSGLKRVLDFAEEIQLKQMPNKVEGVEGHKFVVMLGNGTPALSGNGNNAQALADRVCTE